MQLNYFDAFIALILLFTTLRGAAKGLVWQLAWIAAIVLCFTFSQSASTTIAGWLPIEPPLNRWVAMFILYLVAAFVAFAVAAKLHGWIEKAKFKELDRYLGAFFGLLKGTVFSLVVIFFAVTLSAATRDVALTSHSGYAAALIMDRLHPVFPDELRDVLFPYLYYLDDASDHPAQKEDEPVDGKTKPDAKQPPAAKSSGQPLPPTVNDAGGQRRELMKTIAAVYNKFPQAQATFVEEIQARLTGITDEIVLSVLRDWDADVRLQKPDPEPATNSLTSLAKRIQIHRARAAAAAKSAAGKPADSTRR
jgi:uncharacterized membrane protein required for colicin V production